MYRAARLLAPILLLVVIACQSNAPPGGAEPTDQAQLQVENRSSVDMDVFILRNAGRTRLGFAPANQTTSFALPQSLVAGAGPVRFEARPIGITGSPVLSDPVTVQEGDVITLPIPPQ